MQKARERLLQPGGDRVARLLSYPFQEFFQAKTSSGLLLIGCTIVAMALANSPWSASYEALWETHLTIGLADAALDLSLHAWINDGLMALFFLLVGLELKREFLVGELATPRQALLPILAAAGGALLPAGIYLIFNFGTDAVSGWGVPMATDIAFTLGILALLGSRVPFGLKVFLSALAIVDDLFAVLIIALFYSHGLNIMALVVAGIIVLMLVGVNRLGIRHRTLYVILGIALWLAFLFSGVHATIAGVVLAFAIPVRARINADEFVERGHNLLDRFEQAETPGHGLFMNDEQQSSVQALENACEELQAPLARLEHALHNVVSFVIVPLFVLANAGVPIDLSVGIISPVSVGVALGLILGKQLGVTLFAWLAVILRLAQMPEGVTWRHLYGVGWLAGVGFTMSLFIANLAFSNTHPTFLIQAKIGILAAAIISGGIGYLILLLTTRPTDEAVPDAASEHAEGTG